MYATVHVFMYAGVFGVITCPPYYVNLTHHGSQHTIHQGNHYARNVTIYNISHRYFDTKL